MRSALRRRFLLAMGLPTAMACSRDQPATTTVDAGTVATPTASASAAPSASAVASSSASVAPPPSGALSGASGGGGCGFVVVCRPAVGELPIAHAPAPYQLCIASVPEELQGPDPHREGPFDVALTKERRVKTANTCCYKAPRAFCGGGRPLRGDAGPVVAPIVPNWDWSNASLAAMPCTLDETLAARFQRDAQFEHASVASFARASLQLLALGAPPELVRAAHAASLDEIDHARVCFALAARRGAPGVGPGPLAIERAPFAATLEAFVHDTFLDGCLAETVSAVEVRERALHGTDDVERTALAPIADDEDRHAELAWRMLAWAVRTGGAPARAALRGAIATVDPASDPLVASVILPCADALLQATEVTAPCSEGATPEGSSSAPTPRDRREGVQSSPSS